MTRFTGVLETLYGSLLVHTICLLFSLLGLSQSLQKAGTGRRGECGTNSEERKEEQMGQEQELQRAQQYQQGLRASQG